MASPDPETLSWVRVIVAFGIVFALLAGLGFVLKFVKNRGITFPGVAANQSRRLEIMETLALDMQRRLVIVRCDDGEHLLLLGPEQNLVVDTHLDKTQSPSLRIKSGT